MISNYKAVIYKYPLNIGGVTIVETPIRAELLSVKQQNNIPVAYFLVRYVFGKMDKKEAHTFYTVGTGHNFQKESDFNFVDTLLFNEGEFVLHVFKRDDNNQ